MSSARHAKPRTSRAVRAAARGPAPVPAGTPVPAESSHGGGGRHRAPAARAGVPVSGAVGAALAVAAAGVAVVPGLGGNGGPDVAGASAASDLALQVATDLGAPGIRAADRTSRSSSRAALKEDARWNQSGWNQSGGDQARGDQARGDQARGDQARGEQTQQAENGVEESAADEPAAELRAARERAKALFDAKVEEIAKAAERAAAVAVPAALDKSGCGYDPGSQGRPELTGEQLRNVRAIVAVAKEMDLPPRAAVIALATAQQESWLKNLNWGDRDSLGLFQQRPSMGWGSPGQIRDPDYAARAFFRALTDVEGWEKMPLTVAAQRVQRSAYASRYARWELLAAKLVQDQLDVSPRELACAR